MKIESRKDSDKFRKTFILSGELDVHQAKTLKADILGAIEKDAPWTYVIDMSQVTYIDSSGLGALVYLKKEIMRNGGHMIIENPNENVLGIFRLTKLNEFFELG